MLLKKNTPLEIGLFVLALLCLCTISIGYVDTTTNLFLVAATYCFTGFALTSKALRFRQLVSRLVFVVWLLSLAVVYFAAIATAFNPHWELYTMWLASMLIFFSAGQHVLLQKQS
ncbi:hypothetical protein [Cesiribacter sp. SM1]|uniref:hypothetical protein n=1 Tax=Cesiribacter sp. SM1 TaxID=2861196 RepID=UPI001CD535EC|nr:hypothetical protein [Cesiribacter sp. SM1]